ncbi:MAG: hypothetical protein FWF50_07110 [Defluviitaleaceae bacterium]|nr:hypothetical protein [Defluviitaleaceae bacterium]
MSLMIFLASDFPLKDVENQKLQFLSIREVKALGQLLPSYVSEDFLKNHNQDEKIILTAQSEEDFGELEIGMPYYLTEDYTKKPYTKEIRMVYTEERARQLIEYIKEHLQEANYLEFWSVWINSIEYAQKTHKQHLSIQNLDGFMIEEILKHIPEDDKDLMKNPPKDHKAGNYYTINKCWIIANS